MDNFFFGASLSAHQSEGNNINSDWWKFEHEVLKDPKLQSGAAANHWDLFEGDFKLAHELGHNAHRFSIEWAKIEPKQGQIDYKAVEHYKKVFQELRKHKLTPFTTLFHFSLPEWFAEMGGFEKKDNLRHFINYCKFIGTTFRDNMEYIITMNEPDVYAYHSYMIKKWPPQKGSYWAFDRVTKNLIEAHRMAYCALKAIKPDFQISIAKNNQVFKPDRMNNPLDWILTKFLDHRWNFYFLDKTKKYLDFIGLNYYFYRSVRADMSLAEQFGQMSYPTSRKTDMNWEVYPKGLYVLLQDLSKRYKNLPIIITENGVADHGDLLREDTIKEALYWIFKAKDEGVKIFGYLHWSLIDNYEWDSGFTPKFGLIRVDFQDNFVRTVRPSALVYRNLIRHHLNKNITPK